MLVSNGNPYATGNLGSLDATLGTNTSGAVSGLANAVEAGAHKLANGNAGQKGEVLGQVLYGIAETIVLSKGTGMAANAMKGTRIAAAAAEMGEAAKGAPKYHIIIQVEKQQRVS